MLPINSHYCVSIGLRLLVVLTLSGPAVHGQRQRDREGEKQTEGQRQAGPRETRRTGTENSGQEARPQRNAAPAAATPTAEPRQPGGRNVGGTYNGPGGNPASPERQRPTTAATPDTSRVPQKPNGPDRNANANPQQPRNPGGFDRNANANPQQPRNPGGFDRNANANPQQPRNPGGFDRNANANPQQPRNPGGFDRNANANPQQPRNPGGFDRNTNQPPRNAGSFDRNANTNRDTRSPRGEFTRNQQGRVETFRSRTGSEVRYRPDGRVGSVTRGNMTIQHGAGNSRRIIVNRSDRSMIVTNRNGHGFVQRPFAYRGNEFVNRSYYLRGQTYSRYYRPYSYRGITLNSYVPTRYYNSGFYSWFNRPWSGSVGFAWGWMGASWYSYYRGYFTPYSYYPAPSYWLTDYVLSARLADAYADNTGAPPLYGAVPLSPATKQAISIEIERQLAVERADADALARNESPDPQAGFPRLLSDNNPHVFLVSYNLDVADTAGGGCNVSRGDVLRLASPPPPQATSALLEVVASKPGSCRLGTFVNVGLEDLQDFYNQMRESLAQGVDELRSKAGMNGVPPIPANVNVNARQSAFVEAAPPPDTQVATELNQEVQAATALETEATQDASQGAPQITISLGQSTADVVAMLGNPKQVINLGTKQIYVYDRMKITFLGGKVTDVE